ncbi:MAG: 50S ribosomal protein L9 [Acidimicrobiales bacterium]|jgi:large subunit ribosomal protein L9
MKVILRADIAGVGNTGDLLDISDGYARNYLVPKGLAMRATEGATAQAEAMQRSRNIRDGKDREGAEEIAKRLVPAVIKLQARVGGEGTLYGSVTTSDIAEAVQAQTGIELDRRKMSIDEAIKTAGNHEVSIKLHANVKFALNVEVVPED